MLKKYRVRDYDFRLIIMMVAITVIGILSVGSARADLQNRQLLGFIMGFFMMVVLSFFDYSFFLRFHWGIYLLNITLLLMVMFLGEEVNNAKRWLVIGGIQFQPSELTKIMLILFYSQFIMKNREKLNSLKTIVMMVALLLPPLYLVYEQPDMSTSIVIVVIFCIVWYAAIHLFTFYSLLYLERIEKPFLRKLFPDIPSGHDSLSFIASNMIVNFFGLGNAATPFGLKAMKSLQELNDKKDVASRSMITFLVFNTSGLTLIPTTIISMRMLYGSNNPTEIVLPCILATFFSTAAGLIIDRFLAHRSKRRN